MDFCANCSWDGYDWPSSHEVNSYSLPSERSSWFAPSTLSQPKFVPSALPQLLWLLKVFTALLENCFADWSVGAEGTCCKCSFQCRCFCSALCSLHFKMLGARLSAAYSQAQEHTLIEQKIHRQGFFLKTVTHHQIGACLCVDWCIEVLPPLLEILFFFVHFLLMRASLIWSIKIKKRCSSVACSTCFPKFQATWLIHFPRPLWRWIFSRFHQMTERKRAELWKRKESVLSAWKAEHEGKWSAAP